MNKKCFLTAALLSLAMSMSAQVQLLFMDGGRNVIDRNKKLYWMDGDSDPCFDILNYKKTGNKETFNLKSKDAGGESYSVVITLDANGKEPTNITLSNKMYGKRTSSVKTTSGSKEEDARLKKYFNGLAGNPVEPDLSAGAAPTNIKPTDIKSKDGAKGAADKVKNTAKDTFGKVKGLFKKKNK